MTTSLSWQIRMVRAEAGWPEQRVQACRLAAEPERGLHAVPVRWLAAASGQPGLEAGL